MDTIGITFVKSNGFDDKYLCHESQLIQIVVTDGECVQFSHLNAQFSEVSLNIIFRVYRKSYVVPFHIDLDVVLTGFPPVKRTYSTHLNSQIQYISMVFC
jgi:hypothetical protein